MESDKKWSMFTLQFFIGAACAAFLTWTVGQALLKKELRAHEERLLEVSDQCEEGVLTLVPIDGGTAEKTFKQADPPTHYRGKGTLIFIPMGMGSNELTLHFVRSGAFYQLYGVDRQSYGISH